MSAGPMEQELSTPLRSAGRLYPLAKRGLDLAAAVVGLVLLWPVLVAVAVAIRMGSPGPVLFRQERVGQGGRRFLLYKFRTLRHGAHASGPRGKLHADKVLDSKDPAITGVGRFLRRYGLDELPQMINILRGDMSLVGPRPTIPEQVEAYGPWERRRLEVPQGITGLAQVNGRTSLGWPERIRLDVEYIERRCMREDLRLLWLTFRRVFLARTLLDG